MGVVERTVLAKAASPDWTIPQGFERYSEAEHQTWTTLYERQAEILPGRACDAFLHGLEALDLHGHGIPDFQQLNEKLSSRTGWRVVAVPGLVPDAVFFEHLANRRFPAGHFIRGAGSARLFAGAGHLSRRLRPCADADRSGVRRLHAGLWQGRASRALDWGALPISPGSIGTRSSSGCLETPEGLRIYGAGIVSSRTESIFALDSDSPNRLGFDLERVMRTLYRIDDFQQVYFVIPSLQHLLDVTTGTDFGPLYNKISHMPDIPIAAIEPGDKVFTRGTQDYARSGGRMRQGAA